MFLSHLVTVVCTLVTGIPAAFLIKYFVRRYCEKPHLTESHLRDKLAIENLGNLVEVAHKAGLPIEIHAVKLENFEIVPLDEDEEEDLRLDFMALDYLHSGLLHSLQIERISVNHEVEASEIESAREDYVKIYCDTKECFEVVEYEAFAQAAHSYYNFIIDRSALNAEAFGLALSRWVAHLNKVSEPEPDDEPVKLPAAR